MYMFTLMLVVSYQYKTLVNVYVIDLNILLSDLSCTKVAGYFQRTTLITLCVSHYFGRITNVSLE